MLENKLSDMAVRIHSCAVSKGWWESEIELPEQIALMHSELSEALEEWRTYGLDRMVYYKHTYPCVSTANTPSCAKCGITKPEGVAVELVDCIIRIMDTLEHYNVPIEELIEAKVRYNETRPYRHGGKLA